MNDRIIAYLKLRDVARFVTDAKLAERSIKKLGDAGKGAGESLQNQLGGALSTLQGVMPKARTETGILGLTLGSLITVIVAGAPIIVSLTGAVVALAGSLGAAALGAGVLGTAVAGAAIPLGAFGLVAMQAFQGFQKVNTAFSAWQTQLGMYGQNSKQAETALMRLNSIARQFGGDTMIQVIQKWDDFKTAFRKANAPALNDLLKIFGLFLDAAKQLMPVFSHISSVVGGSLLKAFTLLSSVLTSQSVTTILNDMANVFARISQPLMDAFINFLTGLLTIADRAAPALSWLVDEIGAASIAFDNWASNGNLNGLISQFKSWWNLIKAVGGLLVTVLSGGAEQGQGLVDSLTHIVNRWNAWLNTMKGQNAMAKFFRGAVALTKDVVHALAVVIALFFKWGAAMMPLYHTAFKALRTGWHQFMDAIKPAMPFFRNVLIPILKGIAEGVIASVVGGFKFLIFVIKILAPILGWLGNFLKPLKGAFETIGKIIGFVFGGAILKILGSLGKLTFLLKPLSFLFRILELPIRAAGATLGFLGSKLISVIGFFGRLAERILPGFRTAIDGVVGFITGAASRFYNAGAWLWKNFRKGILKAISSGLGFAKDIGKAVYNFVAGLINKGIPNHLGPIDLPNNPIPLLAAGGVVSGTGSWITGERGPEINTLRNGRVQVVPLSPAVSAQGTSATLAAGENRVVVSKVYLRGRQIAEAVADEAADERARQ